MKKIMCIAMVVFSLITTTTIQGQSNSPTNAGSFLLEANVGFLAIAEQSFSSFLKGGENQSTVGLGVGYFVGDDVVINAGWESVQSEGSRENDSMFRIGASYYFDEKVPLGINFTGLSKSDNYLVGLHTGYAIFLDDNIAIKPMLRYDFALKNSYDNIFQLLINLSVHL